MIKLVWREKPSLFILYILTIILGFAYEIINFGMITSIIS